MKYLVSYLLTIAIASCQSFVSQPTTLSQITFDIYLHRFSQLTGGLHNVTIERAASSRDICSHQTLLNTTNPIVLLVPEVVRLHCWEEDAAQALASSGYAGVIIQSSWTGLGVPLVMVTFFVKKQTAIPVLRVPVDSPLFDGIKDIERITIIPEENPFLSTTFIALCMIFSAFLAMIHGYKLILILHVARNRSARFNMLNAVLVSEILQSLLGIAMVWDLYLVLAIVNYPVWAAIGACRIILNCLSSYLLAVQFHRLICEAFPTKQWQRWLSRFLFMVTAGIVFPIITISGVIYVLPGNLNEVIIGATYTLGISTLNLIVAAYFLRSKKVVLRLMKNSQNLLSFNALSDRNERLTRSLKFLYLSSIFMLIVIIALLSTVVTIITRQYLISLISFPLKSLSASIVGLLHIMSFGESRTFRICGKKKWIFLQNQNQ